MPVPWNSVRNFFFYLLNYSTLDLYTFGRTPWTGDQPVARSLPTHRTTQSQNERTQACMPRMGFEPTIPAPERTNTVHALDGAGTVIKYALGI
jgi:hypothetical protein